MGLLDEILGPVVAPMSRAERELRLAQQHAENAEALARVAASGLDEWPEDTRASAWESAREAAYAADLLRALGDARWGIASACASRALRAAESIGGAPA